MALARFSFNSRGFSLAEVMVAMGILTTVSLGVAQLFAVSTRANRIARGQTSTAAMAEQKMEQLRSLTWGFDLEGQGLPLSDTTTNLAVTPPAANGAGLNPSPVDALDRNTNLYVDFLDANGTWVGTGSTPSPAAVYVRRWSVQPLPTNPNNTLILQVLVTPLTNEASRVGTGQRRRMSGEAFITTVRTRKAQ
jgi:prepilin-type N-terminal cleavage/methylation domain-containing protein